MIEIALDLLRVCIPHFSTLNSSAVFSFLGVNQVLLFLTHPKCLSYSLPKVKNESTTRTRPEQTPAPPTFRAHKQSCLSSVWPSRIRGETQSTQTSAATYAQCMPTSSEWILQRHRQLGLNFSALLLLERHNLNRWCTKYNMGGIPLMGMLLFFRMPCVFTCNGESSAFDFMAKSAVLT